MPVGVYVDDFVALKKRVPLGGADGIRFSPLVDADNLGFGQSAKVPNLNHRSLRAFYFYYSLKRTTPPVDR